MLMKAEILIDGTSFHLADEHYKQLYRDRKRGDEKSHAPQMVPIAFQHLAIPIFPKHPCPNYRTKILYYKRECDELEIKSKVRMI